MNINDGLCHNGPDDSRKRSQNNPYVYFWNTPKESVGSVVGERQRLFSHRSYNFVYTLDIRHSLTGKSLLPSFVRWSTKGKINKKKNQIDFKTYLSESIDRYFIPTHKHSYTYININILDTYEHVDCAKGQSWVVRWINR